VRAAATAVAAAGGCHGPGVVDRLATGHGLDPPPCPACGGCHVLKIIEEVVEAGDDPSAGRA
jgi:hypothetical protein